VPASGPGHQVAGIKLLATTGDGQLNDPGNRTSARTALGYDSNRALGVDRAIALDGGSSSALVVAPGTGAHWVGHGIDPTNPTTPPTSCPTTTAYCSPVPDPTNPVRPVPGWLGLTLS